MKKKHAIKYIGAAFAVVLGVAGTFAVSAESAQAATLSSSVFEETFASKKLSNQWLKNDFTIDADSYYSMRMENQTSYGAAMLYTAYEIHGDCVISFDFCQSNVNTEKARDNWFGILLGYNDDSAHFTGGNAAILSYGRAQTQLMDDGDGTSEKLVANSYNDHTKYSNSFLLSATDQMYTVELVVTSTGTRYSDGENLYKIDGYYYEKSGEASAKPQFTYKGVAADGYFGFSAMASATLDISNLTVTENGATVVSENFSQANGEGKKLLPSKDGAAWKGVNCSEMKIYSYFNGRMALSNAASGLLLSDYNLEANTLNKKTFTISYDTQVKSLPADSAFGVGLGLDQDSTSVRDGSFIGLKGVSDSMFKFVHVVNGETVAQSGEIPKQLYGEEEQTITFSGYYDGTVEVKFAGYTAVFENAAQNGYVAVATLGETACDAVIDNFDITYSEYISEVAPNYAIDFTGTKETPEDDFVYIERYVDERIWYRSTNVTFPKVYKEDATFIQFADSNEYSFFGAKQIYSEFICRFSITVSQDRANATGAQIGLSIGKANRNDRAVDSQTIMFGMTADGMVLQGYNCTLQGADSHGIIKQYEIYPELDFWSETDWKASPATYQVMVVVRGGNAYVYYANEADMSEMNVCKAVVTDLETSGYVMVSGLGGANFRLNDFAMTNIALNSKLETASIGANAVDLEYLNVNFTNDTLYTGSGTTSKLGKGISLGYDSQVKVNAQFSDFLAYVDVNSVVGGSVEIKLGEQVLRLNADGSIYSTLTQLSGSGRFDFNALKNGGTIMLEAMGEKLSLGVVGNAQPADLLEETLTVFALSNAAQTKELTVTTGAETALSLESIRFYTLKPTIAMEADNWEVSDTELPEKNPPPNEKVETPADKKGCSGILSCGAILPLMGIAVVLVRKKEGMDRE